MNTHNIRFCGEIITYQYILYFLVEKKKSTLSGAMSSVQLFKVNTAIRMTAVLVEQFIEHYNLLSIHLSLT